MKFRITLKWEEAGGWLIFTVTARNKAHAKILADELAKKSSNRKPKEIEVVVV